MKMATIVGIRKAVTPVAAQLTGSGIPSAPRALRDGAERLARERIQQEKHGKHGPDERRHGEECPIGKSEPPQGSPWPRPPTHPEREPQERNVDDGFEFPREHAPTQRNGVQLRAH